MTVKITDREIDRAFNRDIAPKLAGLEVERQKAVDEAKRRRRLALFGIAAVAATTLLLTNHFGASGTLTIVLLFITAIVAAIPGFIYVAAATADYESDLRKSFMKSISHLLGDVTYKADGKGFPVQKFLETHLVSNHDNAALEDHLTGRHRNCGYSMVEAKLTTKTYNAARKSSETKTVFNGLLMLVEIPYPIEGTIVIARDWGSFMNRVAGAFRPGTRVEIPHAEFENAYEVHATHPERTLDVITPSFVRNFLELPDVTKADRITAAFKGNKFLVAVETKKGFLEDFSASTEASGLKQLYGDVVHEAMIMIRVIDQLHEDASA